MESRAPGRRRIPDVRGAALLAACLTAVTLAVVQGNDWGWGSLRVLGGFVLAAALLAGFLASSRRHPQPLLDPALLGIRSFSVGNVLTVVAGMGFYAYLLTNILWLQYVWKYSIFEAGLALVPGALVAAVVAGLLGDLAQKYGFRIVVVPGAIVWAAAYLWYARFVDPSPHFLTQWLPGQVLSGIGVGATLPILGSATLAAVPGGRFATASAVVSSARQLGGALGIAILVVIIGTPTPANTIDVLRDGWIFCAVCFAVTAAGALFLRTGDVAATADPEETRRIASTCRACRAASRRRRGRRSPAADPARGDRDLPRTTPAGGAARRSRRRGPAWSWPRGTGCSVRATRPTRCTSCSRAGSTSWCRRRPGA